MYKTLVFLLAGLLASSRATAGIEIGLVYEQYGDCTVRVTHDATPDSDTGTLVFKSFTVIDRVHYPCDIKGDQVVHSLGLAVSRYLSRANMKPVSSIMVGKIAAFPWVRKAWNIKGKVGSYARLSSQEFNQLVLMPEISDPFARALSSHGLSLSGASCEKLQFHSNGAPMNALCWFEIADH